MSPAHRARAAQPIVRALATGLRPRVAASPSPGLVLTSTAAVAWATGGASPAIDRTAATDTVWLAVPADPAASCTVITTVVEAPRLAAETPFAELGWPIVAVGWSDPGEFVRATVTALRSEAADIASDGHPAFGIDISHDVIALRMALTEPEIADLRSLAADATTAVEGALRAWRPGDTDRAVAASIAAHAESIGANTPVLLVGGDDRLRRFRHPVPVGAVIEDVVMAVLVAQRGGLHVALTRYAARPGAAAALADRLAATRAVHAAVLAETRPGATGSTLMATIDAAYRAAGYPGAWREHYQGGPIGFAQREFEIAPGDATSPWWDFALPETVAVAWNPSVAGGAKDEDTYLVTAHGAELLTASTDWPMLDCGAVRRPDVLLVTDGKGD